MRLKKSTAYTQIRDALMSGLRSLVAVRWAVHKGPLWAASSPYELALNSSFYGHNYPFREKRFEL
jgi:hypothetical protein